MGVETAVLAAPRALNQGASSPWTAWCWPGLLAAVFFLQALPDLRIRGSMTMGDGLLFVTLSAYALAVVLRSGAIWWPWWATLSTVLLVVPGLLHFLPDGQGPPGSLVWLAQLWYCQILIPVLVANLAQSREMLRFLLSCWLASVVLAALFALLIYQGWMPMAIAALANETAGTGRVSGFSLTSTQMGQMCALALPPLMAHLLRDLGRLRALAWGLGLGLLIYVINLSGARVGLVAATVVTLTVVPAALLMRVQRVEWFWRAALMLGMAVVVASLIAAQLDDPGGALKRLLGDATAAKSDLRRELLQGQAWRRFDRAPLVGVGFVDLLRPHNVWLAMLSCGGLLAFLAYALRELLLGGAILGAVRRTASTDGHFLILIGLLTSMGVWLLIGMFDTPLLERSSALLLGLILAWGRWALCRPVPVQALNAQRRGS